LVGDGSSTLVWEDPWIPYYLGFIPKPKEGNSPNNSMVVSQLFNQSRSVGMIPNFMIYLNLIVWFLSKSFQCSLTHPKTSGFGQSPLVGNLVSNLLMEFSVTMRIWGLLIPFRNLFGSLIYMKG
jgi:hypothetical protein